LPGLLDVDSPIKDKVIRDIVEIDGMLSVRRFRQRMLDDARLAIESEHRFV
jgi:hypothetical protein